MMKPTNTQRRYHIQVIPVAGFIGDHPAYLYVDANTAADAVSEARAKLRLLGHEPRYFDLKVERVKS